MKAKSIKKYRNLKIVTSKKNALSKKCISRKSLKNGCEETKCTNYVKDSLKSTEEFMTDAIKAGKKIIAEDPDLEKRKRAKRTVKSLLTAKKQMSDPKYFNNEMQFCKKMFCNPTCTDIIVDGIVEDGFNKKLSPKDVKKLKREGAISGCIYA
jgi:hypothetical protein